jgi:hypothetical protein
MPPMKNTAHDMKRYFVGFGSGKSAVAVADPSRRQMERCLRLSVNDVWA